MNRISNFLIGSVLGASVFSFFPVAVDAAEIPPRPFANESSSEYDFTMDAYDAGAYGAEVRFPYLEDKVYKIYTQVGFVTDLVFEKNEKIIYVGGGDTARWKVDTSAVGSEYESYCHLYLKPLETGITTDLIINTDKRVYRLLVTATSRYNPVVRWVYNAESKRNGDSIVVGESSDPASGGVNPAELDFNFKIDKPELGWAPSSVFRSGNKTYIKMKPEIVHYDLPSFFVIDDEGQPNLVGYRYVNGSFVVDKFFDNAVLYAGKKGKVKITYKGKR